MTKTAHVSTSDTIAMPAIEDLVPHAAPMLLIDRVCDAGPNHLQAEVEINETSMFYEKGHGVPTYVGIEYIAQTVAAYAGWRSKQSEPDASPAIGYLLGTRKMTLTRDWFESGTRLDIYVENIFEDGEMGVFKGEIHARGGDGDDVIVAAQINVYQPGDTAQKTTKTPLTPSKTNDTETTKP